MTKKLTIQMTRTESALTWCYWPFQLLILPMLLQLGNAFLKNPLSVERLNFVFFCINFISLTTICHRYLLRCGREAICHPWRTLRATGVAYVAYYVSSWLVSLLIARLAPGFANANDDMVSSMLFSEPVLTTVGTVFLVPVAEEIMYRGLIFGSMYRRSRVLAYIVSSLVFALIHMVGYLSIYTPLTFALSLLQYLPAGLCLGWAYARSNSIWAPIIMHIAINQMGLMSMR